MKCPQCGFENESSHLFCEQCGAKLKDKKEGQFEDTTLINNDVNFPSSQANNSNILASNSLDAAYESYSETSTQNSSFHSNSSFQSSESSSSYKANPALEANKSLGNSVSQKKKWIMIGSTLVLVILVAGGLWFNSQNNSEEKNQAKIVAQSKESKEEETPSSLPKRSSKNFFLEDSETSSIENEKQKSSSTDTLTSHANQRLRLEVLPESSIAFNYSGAACATMALELQGVNTFQSSIGNQLGLNEGKISDYRDLTQLMNNLLNRSNSNTLYSNFYLVADDLTYQEKADTYTLFLNRVDQSLKEGKASLVVVGSSPDGKLQRNFYGLIYGKTTGQGEDTYSIMIPYVDGAKSYEVDIQALAYMIAAPEAFCYIY